MKKILNTFFFFLLCAVNVFSQTAVQSLTDSAKHLESEKKYNEENTAAVELAEINKAIELQPKNFDLYFKRADIYSRLDDVKNAATDVGTAYSFNFSETHFRNGGLLVCSSEQCKERIKIADYLIEKDQKNIIAYWVRYQSRFQLQDYKGTIDDIIKSGGASSAAEEGVERYTNPDGEDVVTEGLLFKTLGELKDDPNIYNYYRRFFESVDPHKEYPVTFGSAMHRNLLRINLYANYAKFYESKKTSDETVALFDKYAKDLGLESRAAIYQKLGKFEAAIADLTKVLETTKYPTGVLFKRAELHILINQFELAIADYEAIKLIEPDLKQNADNGIEKIERKIKKRSNSMQKTDFK